MYYEYLEGLRDYQKTLALMHQAVQDVISGHEEKIYFLEHDHVYTAGSSADISEILDKNISIVQTGRGGRYTYHGPGQLVVYPILDLKKRSQDLHQYVKMLEEVIVTSLSKIGINSYCIDNKRGVFCNRADIIKQSDEYEHYKIASIGIRVSKWVTYHGFAVNISPDLSKFSAIIPCGLEDCGITSIEKCGIKINTQDFLEIISEKLSYFLSQNEIL